MVTRERGDFPWGFLWSCPDNQAMNVLLAGTHMCLGHTPSCSIPQKTDKCLDTVICPTPLQFSKYVLKCVYLHMCVYILQRYTHNNGEMEEDWPDGK